MSRIGRLPIPLPNGVTASIKDATVTVKGPLGQMSYTHLGLVAVKHEKDHLVVTRVDESRQSSSVQGLTRSLINNLVVGVSKGYSRELDVNGVGYRAEVKGRTLVLTLGFSHLVEMALPKGVDCTVEKNTHIVLKSSDKERLGEFAAEVRNVRPPEPYKGKGIKYTDEVIRHKVGKATA
jgi:large subunit ribosomal protein L6